MKAVLLIFIPVLFSVSLKAQSSISQPDSTKKIQLVEASCGKCNFGMKSDECSLAVRINGKPYWVEGADIDSFGDAHASNGFCNAIRKAKVQGTIKGNKFTATYFKLVDSKHIPAKRKTKKA